MKPQKPAEGISTTGVWDDARSFRIGCECTDETHSVDAWLEVNRDADIPSVELAFYVNTWTPYFANWGERLRAVVDILFKGVHKQHTLLLKKQAALNVADAITSTVKLLEEKNG
jgi:hypothetical protein